MAELSRLGFRQDPLTRALHVAFVHQGVTISSIDVHEEDGRNKLSDC